MYVTVAESFSGMIINFEPPDPNDWVEKELVKETDVISTNNNGKIVSDPRLDQYSMRLEQYCPESFEVPQITQWYQPPKMQCKGERYRMVKLQYHDFTIDCLRVATSDRDEALESINLVVIKRFFLKVYYLTAAGDCYVKYFDLPVTECAAEGHVKLPARMCDKVFAYQESEEDVYTEESVVTVKAV